MLFATTATTSVIQIGTVEGLLGILSIILAIGVAWGRLTTRVSNIEKDVDDIKVDIKTFTKDISAIKALVTRNAQINPDRNS